MLDFFCIITKGGFILWCFQQNEASVTTHINRVVTDVFAQGKTSCRQAVMNSTKYEFHSNSSLNVIYVAGLHRSIDVSYYGLIQEVDFAFNRLFGEGLKVNHLQTIFQSQFKFDDVFEGLLGRFEMKYLKMEEVSPDEIVDQPLDQKSEVNAQTDISEFVKISPDEQPVTSKLGKNSVKKKKKKSPIKGPVKKAARKWGDYGAIDESAEPLDYSELLVSHKSTDSIPDTEIRSMKVENKNLSLYDHLWNKTGVKSKKSALFGYFKSLVGPKCITKEMLQPVITNMMEHLCSKNVAAEIAESLCTSLRSDLEGKVLGSLEGIKNLVQASMMRSVQKVLTPEKDFSLLEAVDRTNKVEQRPFTMVFCGVNGVGKSTNLAKIAFYLADKKDFSIMIAACDTFRSGAVEQLRTHVNRLNHMFPRENSQQFTLFDKGYGKDASVVAREAINQAKNLRKNVVLIDTAGRMQDNEPLMKSLSKLIGENNPDMILFVGEALVGSDGLDQLNKFDRALRENSSKYNSRSIDGILLTKFDTIDDKVGAAISMTYSSGKPVLFVGVGQTYCDLKNFDVDSVVKFLFQ